jgi:hypothetical protein
MSSALDSHQYERIERLLYGLPYWEDPGRRKVFLADMLRGHPIWLDLRYGGSQREAAESLLALCAAPDAKLLHGQPPLCALLQALRAEYGQDPTHLSDIDQLASELCIEIHPQERAIWEGAPYRGLSFFDRRHAPIFFGREAELQRLVDALGNEQGRRFLMIVGASGSGKSSLVRAGLWARLACGDIPGEVFHGSAGWLVSVMTPSDAATPLRRSSRRPGTPSRSATASSTCTGSTGRASRPIWSKGSGRWPSSPGSGSRAIPRRAGC